MKIVIIGSGVAGITAAETARKNNPDAEITVFGREEDLFYFRIKLPELVSGDVTADKILAKAEKWYSDNNINLKQGENIIAIDSYKKLVYNSKNEEYKYDRLLLAAGAEANKPLLDGVSLAGVFVLRTLRDAINLRNFILERKVKKAVLIGSGLLGIEAGRALTKLNVEVNVLERFERILPTNTTVRGAVILQKMLFGMGFDFYLNSNVKKIKSHNGDFVDSVLLTDGSNIETPLVVISAGIIPNINLAKAISLKTDHGIIVNDHLQTSDKNIFAAGDCAQLASCRGGLWTVAREQGLVAGHNITVENEGEFSIFISTPPATTLKVAGIDLTSAGNLDVDETLKNSVEAVDNDNKKYRKVIIDNNNFIVGFMNLGSTLGNRELLGALKSRKIVGDVLKEQLTSIDYDFKDFN